MKEKIKKILRIITTVGAILWIFGEIAFTDYYNEPSLTVIIGVLVIWGIIMYSLKGINRVFRAVAPEASDVANKVTMNKKNIGFCHNCGNKIAESSNFCTKCGNKISIS